MRVYASKPNSKGIYDISVARDLDKRPGTGKLVGSACKVPVSGKDWFEFSPSERFAASLAEVAGRHRTMKALTTAAQEALERHGFRL